MFAYNPRVTDRSGEIIASGITGAADVNAKSMETLGNNISSALMSIGNVYGEHEGNKAKGRAFKDVFKVIAPSTGIDMKQLEALTGGSLKSDIDWYNARETISPLLPSLINAQLGQSRMSAAASMPGIRTATTAAGNVAAGQGTMRSTSVPSVNLDVVD